MSYITSVQAGRVRELFAFSDGDTTWRYTSADRAVSAMTHTWASAPIGRGSIDETGEIHRAGLAVTLPITDAFARGFVSDQADRQVSVTMWSEAAADDWAVAWRGRVVGASISGEVVTLNCESVFTSMRRPGLRARFTKGCRHALYGRGCGLDPDDFDTAGTVSDVAGAVVTVTGANAQADGWWVGGMLKTADGTARMIIGHAGNVLTLSRPIPGLAASAAVLIYPGCDHARATCHAKFNNVANYGGFPWIPPVNPFGGTSVF